MPVLARPATTPGILEPMQGTGDHWRRARQPELDGVRGLAILLVLVGHAGANHWLGALAASGVTLFFALSGYLITGVLLAEHARLGRVRLGRFYARRFTRLAPPLLVMLAVTGVVMAPALSAWLPAATWTTNYASLFGADVVPYGHTWSLAVEEQFYLLWPLILLALLRTRRAATGAMVLLAVLMAWRFYQYSQGNLLHGYEALEAAGSPIVAGCVVALVRLRLSRRVGVASLVLLLVLPFVATFTGVHAWMVLPLFVTLPAACLVASSGAMRWLSWRPLTFAGITSYSMYLWHEPVSHFVDGGLEPVGVLAGAAVGLAAYFAVEAPVMRLRRRGSSELRDVPDDPRVGRVVVGGRCPARGTKFRVQVRPLRHERRTEVRDLVDAAPATREGDPRVDRGVVVD